MRTKTPITTAAIATINTMSSTTAPPFVGSSFSAPMVVLVVDELVVDELVVVDRFTVVFGRRPVVDGEVTGGAVAGVTAVASVVSGVVPTVVSDCANAGAAASAQMATSAATKMTKTRRDI
ncbi:MAG: hypothetical protein H0U92_12065 [Actinobacteria bacterium]|nr:hypothetical protein [Actinomycetota bacterium]